MSATISQPVAGQHKSAAPFGVVALVAGALALGAVGIALGQGIKVTPAAGAVPADVQAALIAQRAGEKAALFPARDPRIIQHEGEMRDRMLANAPDARLLVLMAEQAERQSGATTATQYEIGFLVPRSVSTPTTVESFPGKAADDTVAAAHDKVKGGGHVGGPRARAR